MKNKTQKDLKSLNIEGISDQYLYRLNGEELEVYGTYRGLEKKFAIEHLGYKNYLLAKSDSKKYTSVGEHALKMAIKEGYSPFSHEFVIDHINENRSDNRFENLEVVTQAENVRRAKRNNGVYLQKTTGKYLARIIYTIDKQNVRRYLGLYNTRQEADEVADRFFDLSQRGHRWRCACRKLSIEELESKRLEQIATNKIKKF